MGAIMGGGSDVSRGRELVVATTGLRDWPKTFLWWPEVAAGSARLRRDLAKELTGGTPVHAPAPPPIRLPPPPDETLEDV